MLMLPWTQLARKKLVPIRQVWLRSDIPILFAQWRNGAVDWRIRTGGQQTSNAKIGFPYFLGNHHDYGQPASLSSHQTPRLACCSAQPCAASLFQAAGGASA